jgi:hypothetical protein
MRGAEFDAALRAQPHGVPLREPEFGQPLHDQEGNQPGPLTHVHFPCA